MFNPKIVLVAASLFMSSALAMDQQNQSVIDLSKIMKMDQLLENIAESQVVFVGETHDRYDHHLNQLRIIESMHERHEKLAIGMEFIQQPFQAALDEYIAGSIDEATMLKRTEYFERWRYDFRLYRPIFAYAREHGIPIIALNIDRDITDKVKKEGLDSLSEEQKKSLPAEIDRDDEDYRNRLKQVYMHHPHAEEGKFDSFMEIQLLWDESMAERAAKWFQQHPDGRMVILAGSGHIMYGSGIPNRLQRRTPIEAYSVINISGETQVSPSMGDYVIMTEELTLPPSGKLGVFLDASKNPPSVTGFSEGSGAKKAGMEKNDKIVRINDREISSYFDIRIALMDKPVDETVNVEVVREGVLFGDDKLSYDVTLK